jgi:GT2 family glycosyltransferase
VTVSLVASVIVLGYRGKGQLGDCLRSVLDQACRAEEYEVIYADNASGDGSPDWVAEHFPSVRVLVFERNLGFAEGNNRAAEKAQGRYLLFLNQDTVVHRHWLANMVGAVGSGALVRAGHAAGCPLRAGYMEREERVQRGFLSEVSGFGAVEPVEIDLPAEPLPTLHIGGGSMILDRQVLGELSYIFDPTLFAYGEDLDLGLRLNGLGYRVVFVPTAICYHEREGRAEPSCRTMRRTALATRNRFLVYLKNMYADEFLLALPLLFVGSIAKMRSMVTSPAKRAIYGLALVPFTAYYLVSALLRIPRYTADRRRILSQRSQHHARHWLLDELRQRRHRGTSSAAH